MNWKGTKRLYGPTSARKEKETTTTQIEFEISQQHDETVHKGGREEETQFLTTPLFVRTYCEPTLFYRKLYTTKFELKGRNYESTSINRCQTKE